MGVLDAMPSSNLKPENEDAELDEKKIYRTTYMFSATMPPAVERLARKYLRNPVVVTIGTAGKATDLITQHVIMVKETEKLDRLCRVLNEMGDKTAIIFVNTKKNADSLSRQLDKAGYRVTTLHGGKTQEQREVHTSPFQ
jgi:ATP-dependent RNA helicase DDX23/PRP28